MTELGEPAKPDIGHTDPNAKCPFCPPKARKEYKTYPGVANDSDALGEIMLKPECLVPKQSGARDQNRQKEDGWVIEQSRPDPREFDETTFYTFQAHHLISGKQAMKGNAIEQWIKASKKNEKATGYSVNNTYNGFWAPSVPKEFVGKWSKSKRKLTDKDRQDWAEDVMKDAVAQIHIGPHNITDKDDPKGDKHSSYDRYLKNKLKTLSDRIGSWADACLCEQKKKKMPMQCTHRVHDAIDAISDHMEGKITGSVKNWDVFLSKYAMAYHKKPGNCRHGKRGRV